MKNQIKICHLTSAHSRFDVRIFRKECVSLAKHGFDVSLIVADSLQDEVVDGVKIYGVKSETKRLKRFLRATKNVYDKALELDADLYHFHDPELMFFGRMLKNQGKKVVYDVHEDLPRQIKAKHYLNKLIRTPLSIVVELCENYIAKNFDLIITSTPYIKKRFSKVNKNAIDINNYPILEELLAEDANWGLKNDEVTYIGGISENRGIKELIESLRFVDIKLNLAGSYQPTSLRDDLKKSSVWNEKVNEFGFVGRGEIKKILSQSKIGIVTLYPIVNYLDSLPVKMFEYMASGIPIVASDFPQWKEIVHKYNCGICVDPKKPKQIADAIKKLINNDKIAMEMGENGRRIVLEKYNWEKEALKLVNYYNDIWKSN